MTGMTSDVRISLRAARVNAGLTQKKASDMLRIGTSTLQGYENGRRIPRWDLVERMQRLYGIDSANLFLSADIA